MSFGITDAGFVLKTRDDIQEELNLEAQKPENFGPDIDLSEFGEVGQFVQLMSQASADIWENLEDTYYSNFIDTAEGVSLDRVLALGGLSRATAKKALVSVNISGVNGTTIPVGTLVQTPQAIQFETITLASAQTSGTAVDARAVVAGTSGVVPAGTIVEYSVTIPDLTAVTNPLASIGGVPIESDVDARLRYQERDLSGGSSVPAVINALLSVDNVINATVTENTTDTTDVNGLPPHSIHCVVSGSATDTEIAEAIFNSKAAGIATYGTKSKIVLDVNGDSHLIKWDEPTQVFVNVIVNITSTSEWVSSNEIAVKTATVKAIGGIDTIGTTATGYGGIQIGEDVRSYLPLTEMDDITGIDTIEVLIALAPATPTASTTLVMSPSQSARVDTANVTVVVT
jgi:uncharacterized phage protein gp47/JayE